MKKEYDVIVIGAGFGGPVAAKKCADAGLSVLLLERAEHPGEKVISGLGIPIYGFLYGPDFIRDGNPPVERPVDGIKNYIIFDIDKGDIFVNESLKMPRHLAPIFACAYNAYCMDFCTWEAKKAVEAGAELRTSTTVIDFIKENGHIKGVILENGEHIRAKIVLDSEGSQGLLAIKAGVREKYPPDTISLADTYDYEMPKEKIDSIFGHTLRFCWGWDEQKIAPPLGYGNGLMLFIYRNSFHFMQDQCLKTQNKIPDLRNLFTEYHNNITGKLPFWKDEVAPHVKLRARMWQGFEIFVGLNEELRSMPNHTDGMILIGDVAGLESCEMCDGVPAAWFSADIAADVAIEAIKAGDTSKAFLKRYDKRIKKHPIIQWSIREPNRFKLREAQKSHNRRLLKKYVNRAMGIGVFTHNSKPFMKMMLRSIIKDPAVTVKWKKMFYRYYYNWHHERFDYREEKNVSEASHTRTVREKYFNFRIKTREFILKLLGPVIRLAAIILYPLAYIINPIVKILMPVMRPFTRLFSIITTPMLLKISRSRVRFTVGADPSIFDSKGGVKK